MPIIAKTKPNAFAFLSRDVNIHGNMSPIIHPASQSLRAGYYLLFALVACARLCLAIQVLVGDHLRI